MTMTSTQLVDLLSLPFADGEYRGKVMFAGRQRNGLPPAEAPLLEALLSVATAAVAAPYSNPVRAAVRYPETPKPLAQSDLMWIDRLPRDPTAMSNEDARTLATLAANTAPGSGDARLLASVLAPVAQLHA